MIKRLKITGLLLIISSILLKPAYAYKTEGHVQIEQKALELLKKMPATIVHPSGMVMYSYLINHGYLKDPSKTYSTYPDLSFIRQFQQDRQIYHFMTSNRNVVKASGLSTQDERQRKLLEDALPDCLKMMYFMYREITDNSVGSSEAGRGIYVLMHIIADSYSREHATREPGTFQIITIKGWKFNRWSWPAEAKEDEPVKFGSVPTAALLHAGLKSPSADDEWKGNKDGLSDLAYAASQAVSDYLAAVYMAKQDASKADITWKEMVIEPHFKPTQSTSPDSAFVLSPSGKAIQFNFPGEYKKDYRTAAFEFDRFMRYYVAVYSKANFPEAIKYRGLELGFYFVPRYADRSSFLRQIPAGAVFSFARVDGMDPAGKFFNELHTKAFLSAHLLPPALSFIQLMPRIGASGFFFNDKIRPGFALGIDGMLKFNRDMGFGGWPAIGSGLSLGYEWNTSGYPSRHALNLKLILNTWHARVIKKL